jgi:predicted GTPase
MNYFNNFFVNNNNGIDANSSGINICVVGCVSAGKSTILNAFFGCDYTQCKIKRTTMMPNKFVETNSVGKIDSVEKINKTISDVNTQIYAQTDRGAKPLRLEDYGNELTFYVEGMEMNVGNDIKITIYDIPGLNDARTKEIYYNYLEKNFFKFNIILFVVDIQSGLNTSDEMDILKFLSKNIAKHKTESNKNISLLGVVNKADDMQQNGTKLEVLGELGEMFEQTSNTIKQEFEKKRIQQNLLGCIPVCGLDSHLYRMIKKYQDINKLSDENILRIGVNEEEMKKMIKQINTIIYRKINLLTNPNQIKKFYDTNIKNVINSDKSIKNKIKQFIDFDIYPNFFVDRILELVVIEFSEQVVPINKFEYIQLFEHLGNLKTEIIDLVLDSLLSNPRGTGTIGFDNLNQGSIQNLIRTIDKTKISTKFVDFLRFFLANMYSNISKPEELVVKLMIFNRYEEIPMRQFINDLRIEKKNIDTNKQIQMYSQGLGKNYTRENLFELYYIVKCREFGDNDNFLSHDKPITIDFTNII